MKSPIGDKIYQLLILNWGMAFLGLGIGYLNPQSPVLKTPIPNLKSPIGHFITNRWFPLLVLYYYLYPRVIFCRILPCSMPNETVVGVLINAQSWRVRTVQACKAVWPYIKLGRIVKCLIPSNGIPGSLDLLANFSKISKKIGAWVVNGKTSTKKNLRFSQYSAITISKEKCELV